MEYFLLLQALVGLIFLSLFIYLIVRHFLTVMLVNACREGSVDKYKKVMAMIRSRPFNVSDNVMIINCYDGSGLREAIKHKHTEIWEDLLANSDVNPNLSDDQKETALHTSCRWGNSRAAAKLISMENMVLNGRDQFGYTPVLWAAKLGKIEALKVMLAEPGVRVNICVHGVNLKEVVNESFESNLITRTQMNEVKKLIEIAEKERKTNIFAKETQSKKESVIVQGLSINKRLKSEDFESTFEASFTNSPAPNSVQPSDKIKNLSDRITWKISDNSDCIEQIEKETFSGDFMLTSPSLRPPGDKSPCHQTEQSPGSPQSETALAIEKENKKVEEGFERIAKAVEEAAEKDLAARKRQYLTLRFKKEKVEIGMTELKEQMETNMFDKVPYDNLDEQKPGNKVIEEKLNLSEEELKKIEGEIANLYTSIPASGEILLNTTKNKEDNLGEILDEVELEELHINTPRLVISMDSQSMEAERLI